MTSPDPRIDVVRQAKERHSIREAATPRASGGERWRCRCGADYRGLGALDKGRLHDIVIVLEALDAAEVNRA